jgi:signal transduction histidine kinase/CheY-like chemotaxis protein
MSVFLSLAPWLGEEAGGKRPWYLTDNGPILLVRTAAWLVAAGGAAILLGFLAGEEALPPFTSGLARVPPLTGFAFLCSALALLAGARLADPSRPAGGSRGRDLRLLRGGAGAMLAIGLARILQDLLGSTLPLDFFPFLWLPAERLGELRMAPATAGNLVLLGAALLLARGRPRAELFYQVQTLAVLAVSALSLGYVVYGGQPLILLAQMSIPVTLLMLLTCVAMLWLRPDYGLVRLFRAPTEGGMVVRYMLLPAMSIPPFLGWLRLKTEAVGIFPPGSGMAFFALTNISIIAGLIWSAARWLDRADARRRDAEARTLKQLEKLQLLHQITRATAERQDPASIFQVAVRSIEERLPADFSCVCRYDQAASTLEVVSIGIQSHGMAGELGLTENSVFGIDPNGLQRCLSGLLVYEEDVARIDMPFPRRLLACGLRSLVLAPLQAESKVFGLMVVARREVAGFTSGECEFLRQLCDNVALASSQAELNAALQAAYVDLRQTQQTVIQQERLRALGEMASGIAHDINNSISPAAIHAELLLEREKSLSPEGLTRLATLQRAIGDVAHTVSRMQELYRRRAPNQSPFGVKLNLLVEQVLELTRSRWRDMPQQRGIVIEVVTNLAAELPLVSGIESEIREALTNLVFNAVDAMPEGGRLDLRTRARKVDQQARGGKVSGQLVLLEVADTGTGMSEETRARCFEPFYTTKGDRGSGLGLSMVFSVAERHEADVEIESAPGKGTVVRLIFPAAQLQAAAPAEPEPTLPMQSLRILVVDDDPILLETLCDALAGDGHRVVAASGGAAGIDVFRKSMAKGPRFDLVFTDLGMPQIDGRRVAASIKEASATTPIILLTGWGQRMVDEGDLPPHVDLIMSKPPRIKELRRAVQRLHQAALKNP